MKIFHLGTNTCHHKKIEIVDNAPIYQTHQFSRSLLGTSIKSASNRSPENLENVARMHI